MGVFEIPAVAGVDDQANPGSTSYDSYDLKGYTLVKIALEFS